MTEMTEMIVSDTDSKHMGGGFNDGILKSIAEIKNKEKNYFIQKEIFAIAL